MTVLATRADLGALFRRVRVVLLDFDGPICALFAGIGAENVANDLRQALADASFPADGAENLGPHAVLHYAALLGPRAGKVVEETLARDELDAVRSSRPPPGACAFLAACERTGRLVAIVSNNNADAIKAYLDLHGLTSLIAHVEGRDPDDPQRMKPNPWTLGRTLTQLRTDPESSAFVGDAVSDMQAATTIGIPPIGYANRPAKVTALHDAGAVAVVTEIAILADAVAATP